nr:ribosome assembly RNA-binding protein YhbY [uncultured Desulfobulbus sp.]
MSEAQKKAPIPVLGSFKKKKLRSLGHHLEPIVYVGKEGLTEPLHKSLEAALKARELVKVKLGQNCPIERKAAGEELAELCRAALVQVIGRMILLYKPNPELPAAKRVQWQDS